MSEEHLFEVHSMEYVAAKLFILALSAEDGRNQLIGDVMAIEIALLAVQFLQICPLCGSAEWDNDECGVCTMGSQLKAPKIISKSLGDMLN